MSRDESFYRDLVDHGAAALIVLDRTGYVRYANPSAVKLLGVDPTGTIFSNTFGETTRDQSAAFIEEIARRDKAAGSKFFVGEATRPDRSLLRLEVRGVNALGTKGVNGIVLTVVDASAQYQREQELVAAATLERLTGLPNRNVFLDRVRYALRSGLSGTAAYADIDRFKMVNDFHGHAIGDEVLIVVARRLVKSLPESATVARLGGDEFGLFLPNASLSEATQLIEQSLVAIAKSIIIGGVTIPATTLSVGLANVGGQGAEMILRDCDMAMYAAKQRGRNRVVAFGDDVRKVMDRRRELAATIAELSEENQKLHVEARTDALTGLPNFRALVEIEDKVLGNANCPWTSVAVLFLGVDHFGSYNKLYSDPGGDKALKEVARALKQAGRESDQVFRKGGEEFCGGKDGRRSGRHGDPTSPGLRETTPSKVRRTKTCGIFNLNGHGFCRDFFRAAGPSGAAKFPVFFPVAGNLRRRRVRARLRPPPYLDCPFRSHR